MGELILVVRTADLKKHADFQGFMPMPQAEFERLYNSVEVLAMDRDKAEHDPSFKQLIAYSAVRCRDNFMTYLRGRGQGEARLHGNRSIGIGGHINSGDHATLFGDDHLKVAAHREMDEEIEILEKYDLRLAGLLNDDSTDVGKVHLGLVYVADLEKPDVAKREKAMAAITFATSEELREQRDQFETWSQILIDNLDKL